MNSISFRDFLLSQAGLFSASASGSGAVGLKTPALETVRAAFIGIGGRARGHLGHLLKLEGAKVVALADPGPASIEAALKLCEEAGAPKPEVYGNGPQDYKRMLERSDIDLVFVSTAWEDHARQSVDVMKSGKHVFIEVPAAVTLDDCWALVDTAERTGKHCMMLENCCYGREELFCLNLCRLGVLGELLHGEGAYIHELRGQMENVSSEHLMGIWRTNHFVKRNGNLYPTHGLGPIAQYMGINRGDRFEYLTAVASQARGRELYAKKKFPADHRWNQVAKWNCGDINTTLIKTALGRSVMVQWDETSPRPYDRLNLIQGTRGTFGGWPNRLVIEDETPDTHHWVEGDALAPWFEKYDHPLWKKMGQLAEKNGGHGGMDFLMIWRAIWCLRNGEALDQDVYDAASWSAVGALSEKSIAKRSQSVDFPDFTRGRWKTTPPLGIVS
ncbi:MAG: Gfo/Idh/MocA family oxidoreductase [Spirochaetes bacterium]|nr:Gfo/Idh/MocA family oxidoreductase [Spirochaetota bacterium]